MAFFLLRELTGSKPWDSFRPPALISSFALQLLDRVGLKASIVNTTFRLVSLRYEKKNMHVAQPCQGTLAFSRSRMVSKVDSLTGGQGWDAIFQNLLGPHTDTRLDRKKHA